jgi:hypothetical protein
MLLFLERILCRIGDTHASCKSSVFVRRAVVSWTRAYMGSFWTKRPGASVGYCFGSNIPSGRKSSHTPIQSAPPIARFCPTSENHPISAARTYQPTIFFDVRSDLTDFLTYHGFVTIASSSHIISLDIWYVFKRKASGWWVVPDPKGHGRENNRRDVYGPIQTDQAVSAFRYI